MMYALGFIWMFMMGGFTGIMHSAAPADAQQQDAISSSRISTTSVIGGSLLALLAGLYYWLPKMSGRMATERLGKLGSGRSSSGSTSRSSRCISSTQRHAAAHLHLRRQPPLEPLELRLDLRRAAFGRRRGVRDRPPALFALPRPAGRNDPWHGRTLECPALAAAGIQLRLAAGRAGAGCFLHDKHTDAPAPSIRPPPGSVPMECTCPISPGGAARVVRPARSPAWG